jgi:hypothetical protein
MDSDAVAIADLHGAGAVVTAMLASSGKARQCSHQHSTKHNRAS